MCLWVAYSRPNSIILQQKYFMKQQNYANHSRFVAGFHFVLGTLLLIGTVASLINIWKHSADPDEIMSKVLIALLFVCGLFLFWFSRQFPIKAQDRAIRAEENLRYFILTRKALDSRVTLAQIIALRFAPDEEFVILADRTVNENLTPAEIKKEIKEWRADNHRA
jgi:hypothetical protein